MPLCAVPSAAGVTAHTAHVDSRANAAQSFQFTRIDEDALATRPNRVASQEPPQLSAAAVLPSQRQLARAGKLSPRHSHSLPAGGLHLRRNWPSAVEGQSQAGQHQVVRQRERQGVGARRRVGGASRVESPPHGGHGRLDGPEDVVDRFLVVGQALQGPTASGARPRSHGGFAVVTAHRAPAQPRRLR